MPDTHLQPPDLTGMRGAAKRPRPVHDPTGAPDTRFPLDRPRVNAWRPRSSPGNARTARRPHGPTSTRPPWPSPDTPASSSTDSAAQPLAGPGRNGSRRCAHKPPACRPDRLSARPAS
ncbi:hypothetical protein ACFWF9_20345 [Streptomyces roseolus]|uniref:hypothetical protein n=1 Tax=Streptomyces roseolus TaxID=67358 RepID=UPI0036690646